MATANPKPPPATTPIDDGLGIARKCWIKYKKESTLSLYSPFVVSLASGNLNVDTFRHYIAQDVYFLEAFAKAYEMFFPLSCWIYLVLPLFRSCAYFMGFSFFLDSCCLIVFFLMIFELICFNHGLFRRYF